MMPLLLLLLRQELDVTSGQEPAPAPAGTKRDKFGSEYSPRDFLVVSLLLYVSLCLKKVLTKPSAGSKVPEGCNIVDVIAAYAAGSVSFDRIRLKALYNHLEDHMLEDRLALKEDLTKMTDGSCWVPDFTAARAATFKAFGCGPKGRKIPAVTVACVRDVDKENDSTLANNRYLMAMYDLSVDSDQD